MNKRNILNIASIALIILGITMIYIGGFYTATIMLPPIITGVGFFIISWVLHALKN